MTTEANRSTQKIPELNAQAVEKSPDCEGCGNPNPFHEEEFANWCSSECAELDDFHDDRSHGCVECVACGNDCENHIIENGGNICLNCIISHARFIEHFQKADSVEVIQYNTVEDWDSENELFKAHIQDLLFKQGFHILEVLEGWERVDCPACGSKIEFERDGDGVSCYCEECRVSADLDYVL